MTDLDRPARSPEHGISSRVTVIDAATLYVTESAGDFASTVLEDIVQEHVPAFTHNPPTLILLESGFNESRDRDLELTEPTALASELIAVLRRHICSRGSGRCLN